MSKTRDNHYVPEWYQKGFWEPGKATLAYLDLAPEPFTRHDGSKGHKRALHDAPPARAFFQTDLYSTFFGTIVNDEIERKLFGDIDTSGARAVRAFAAGDRSECHHNFHGLFEYIDIQKLRTPKGLAWLRSQYPTLSQNELMMEMQAIRMMHCTIWTEGVREIVSAEDSEVKFIVSDHPVTVFNPAAPPGSLICKFPGEPGIELKGTQTLFPLNRDHCLILTNLEFAQNPGNEPLSKRTFPRRFRSSMVRTDGFIRSRRLSADEVRQINRVIRSRAHRFVAAGRKEWLPEPLTDAREWKRIGELLLPPTDDLHHFGGEMFAKLESGAVHYQDAYGRTEKEREFLKKTHPDGPWRARDRCGCGSDKAFVDCCQRKPVHLRPAWDQLSIRERNLALFRGIADILELHPTQDWTTVRRAMTDEKISRIYFLYEALWPLETDLLKLLPKPDGSARAVYTGVLHPSMIFETALGSSLLFDELLIEHPFVNPRTVRDEYNPVKNPSGYRQEILKSVLFFLQVMPLVEVGLVNLFPDPLDFDYHLRDQSMHLAKQRWQSLRPLITNDDDGMKALAEEEAKRSLLLLSDASQRVQIKRAMPDLDEEQIEDMLEHMQEMRERDPQAVLQDGAFLDGEKGGQLTSFRLGPNFEMAMYIAQATGAAIVTDHPTRWKELLFSILTRRSRPVERLAGMANSIQAAAFSIAQDHGEILQWRIEGQPRPHAPVFQDAYRYLGRVDVHGVKPNVENRLRAQFEQAHHKYEAAISKRGMAARSIRVQCAFPKGGIFDSTITRLLLMSSSEHHVPSVPMAFFLRK